MNSHFQTWNLLQQGANGALSKSTEDVSQLQRDLQDSHEREADLREQLKFAEEEVSLIIFCFFLICEMHFLITGAVVEEEAKSRRRRERIFGHAIEKNGNEER